jgi:hypothetical protein
MGGVMGGVMGRAGIVLGCALALLSSCSATRLPLLGESRVAPQPDDTVPIAVVLNEIKCDYLDFAYSDQARARRLAVGKVTGSVTLAVARDGARGALGVAVAPGPLRIAAAAGGAETPAPANGLTIPFAMDPTLALNPGAAGIDCSPAARLAQPILPLTALADGMAAAADGGRPYIQIRSPLRYQGQFYLQRDAGAGAVAAVPVRVDPARVTEPAYLQAFDITVETGGASWFADVGPATAEPRPAPARRRAPLARPTLPAPVIAAAPPPSRVLRVPQAPRRPGAPRELAATEHRCIGGTSDLVCY